MTWNNLKILLLLIIFVSCKNDHKKSLKDSSKPITENHTLAIKDGRAVHDTTIVNCDSIYPGKRLRIVLVRFDTAEYSFQESQHNAIFRIERLVNGRYKQLFQDSVYSAFEEIEFKDFNGDDVKDILLEHYVDVRSNSTYYLYLSDIVHGKFRKIKGFGDIKNPGYLPKYDLIDSYVVSGTNWTDFYKIRSDSVRDFNVIVYDDHKGNYAKKYNKALKFVLKKIKQ